MKRLLCSLGLHGWEEKAVVTEVYFRVFNSKETQYTLKKCKTCGTWNIHPGVFGITINEDGSLYHPSCTR